MKPKSLIVIVLLCLGSSLLGGCGGYRVVIDVVPAVDALQETTVMEDEERIWGANKVALIDVTGVINNGNAGLNPLEKTESPVARFAEALKKARKDRKVKAIIVQVNSPGGTVTGSDLMYRELTYFKEKSHKPVVILMGEVAASGGYYISLAGDELIANPTTITGSIGVIMQTVNFSEGLKRIGVKADAITSGPNKAVGSPWEPMSAEHRALLQGIVLELYAVFRGRVVENRPQLEGPMLDEITDGRVVTGTRAAELGIVDGVGDMRDAFAAAKRRAGITSAILVKYHRPTQYVGSAYAREGAGPAEVNMLQLNVSAGAQPDGAHFYYLWDPAAW